MYLSKCGATLPDPGSLTQVAGQPWQLVSAVSGLVGVLVGGIISGGVQAWLLSRRIVADETLAERKFNFDKDLAERKFKYDRDLHDHKRKVELAEQALTAFYEARDVFISARSRGIYGGEGASRTALEGESKAQQEQRNRYFIPIERLTQNKEVFARLRSLRYSFIAYFGEAATAPFEEVFSVQIKMITAASIIIQMAPQDDEGDHRHSFKTSIEPLLNELGWGTAERPDESDRKIEKAIHDIEELCRAVFRRA